MSATAQSQERRGILATARRYRRDGYKVNGPDEWTARPGFLGDLVPDLIAERDDDKVVIEVRQAAAVRGANDIVELAERVEGQPGWRFELIGLPNPSSIAMPDLARGGEEIRRLLDQDFLTPAFVLACALIENLAGYALVLRKRKPEARALRELVRDLVVLGLVDEETKFRIDGALARRNALLHGENAPVPTRGDVEALMAVAHDLRKEIEETANA